MSSIMEMVAAQLGGGTLDQISRQLGTDEGTAGSAISAALPALLGALARNASNPEGAQSLDNALAKDHDGGVLDNLSGFLGQAQSGPGDGILNHVFGSRRPMVEQGVSKSTGMDAAKVGELMTMLAPVVMGALGRAKRQTGMQAQDVANMLGSERQALAQNAPQAMGLLDKMLDADGDGDVDLGDIAQHGFGLLSKMMKKP
jgi:hypothetical protein